MVTTEADLRGLVQRAREADPDAWEALYRRAYPRLFAYARHRLATEEQAEDAVSETMTRAMRRIGEFTWSGAGIDGWLFGIARNVVYETYREGARARPADLGSLAAEPEAPDTDPLAGLVRDEEGRQLRAAFGKLAADDRELLELRVIAGLDSSQVGIMLGRRPRAGPHGPVSRAAAAARRIRRLTCMTDDKRHSDDEQTLSKLGEALGYDPHREPPPSSVEAVRAAAEQLRVRQGAEARSRASDERAAGGTVSHLPRRRQVVLGGIAASVGALAGFGGRELLANDPAAAPPTPRTEAIAFAGAPAGVRTNARLINHTWGTELMLEVSGFPAGKTYRVVYRPSAGRGTAAGSFVSVGPTTAKCRFNASTLRAKLAAITVLDGDDVEVMRADLS